MTSLDAALLRLLTPPTTDLLHLLLQLLPALLLSLYSLHIWLALTRLCYLTTAPEYKSVPARSQMGSLPREINVISSMLS